MSVGSDGSGDVGVPAEVVFAYLDEPPFCWPGEDGRPHGCDVEVAEAVLKAIGVERISTRLVTFAELMPGVAEGAWTINTPLFVTPERALQVAFSRPVWSLADGFMMRADNSRQLDSYRAIAANEMAVIGVVAGQVQHQSALAAGVPTARTRLFATQKAAVEAVLSGVVDAYASVAMAHRGYLREHVDIRLEVIDLGVEGKAKPAVGAFSFALSDVGLREAFDRQLAAYLGSPEHVSIMERHGFSHAEIVGA